MGVGKTKLLGPLPFPLRKRAWVTVHGERMPLFHDHQQLIEEPRVDFVGIVKFINGHATAERFTHMEQPFRSGDRRTCNEINSCYVRVVFLGRVAVQTEPSLLKRTKTLLKRFRKSAADGHRFAHGLHASSEHTTGTGKFLERPSGDFRDDVVDDRLETGICSFGDVVRNLVERVTHGELGGDLGDRVARGLRC